MHLQFISDSHSPSRSLKSMRRGTQAPAKAAVTCTVSMITEKEFSTQSLANKYWQIPLKVKYLLSKLLKWDWPVTEHSPEKCKEPLIAPVPVASKILPVPPRPLRRKSSPVEQVAKGPNSLQTRKHQRDAHLTVYSCKSLPVVVTEVLTKAGEYGINRTQELKLMATEKPI